MILLISHRNVIPTTHSSERSENEKEQKADTGPHETIFHSLISCVSSSGASSSSDLCRNFLRSSRTILLGTIIILAFDHAIILIHLWIRKSLIRRSF